MFVSNAKYIVRDFSKKKIWLLKDSTQIQGKKSGHIVMKTCILTDLKTRDLCNKMYNQSILLNSHHKTKKPEISL